MSGSNLNAFVHLVRLFVDELALVQPEGYLSGRLKLINTVNSLPTLILEFQIRYIRYLQFATQLLDEERLSDSVDLIAARFLVVEVAEDVGLVRGVVQVKRCLDLAGRA